MTRKVINVYLLIFYSKMGGGTGEGKIDLKGIEKILEQKRTCQTKDNALSDNVSKKIEKLQERIKKGETTGDYVTDLCILQFGGLYSHYIKELSQTYSELKKHDGELVLYEETIERALKEDRGHYTPKPDEIVTLETGLITPPYLQRRKEDIVNFIGITVKDKLYGKVDEVFIEYLRWERLPGDIIRIAPTKIPEKSLENILGISKIDFHSDGDYKLSLLSTNQLIGDKKVEKYLRSLGVKEMPIHDRILKRDNKIALNEQTNLITRLVEKTETGQKLKEKIKELEPEYKKITYRRGRDQDGSSYEVSSNPELKMRYSDLIRSYDKIKTEINEILSNIRTNILPPKVDLSKVEGMKKEINVGDFLEFVSSEYKTKKK